jgi:two-component system, NarL family, response regulator NreC
MPIKILIADDHGVLRAGLRALLNAEEGLEVVGEAADGPETLRLALEFEPDMVLLDISMPGPGGIEITRQLKKRLPQTRVLILSAHEEQSLLRQAIQAGAAGYITKRAIESELTNAIQAAWRGDIYVHPTMTRALLKDAPSPPSPEEEYCPLTPRETEVLALLAQGHTNRQTAKILNISVRTVETHRANILDKLQLRGRVALVRYAKQHNMLE